MTHTPSAQAIGLEVVLATDASKPKSPLPTGWHEFADKFGATRYPSVAPECAKFLQATGLQVYIPGDVLLFCHEMHTPGGDRRLVMVFANGKVLTEYQRVGNVLYPIVLTPATLRRAPEGMPQLQPIHDASNRTALEFDRGFRLYEGTLDPADPTRLLIAYEVDGKPGRIEGQLGKNGMLTLRVLDGPALTKEY